MFWQVEVRLEAHETAGLEPMYELSKFRYENCLQPEKRRVPHVLYGRNIKFNANH
jgi:hypothetical protein